MSAFAEFLAYKQRVPVRGAIMLNQDMDQVVLVKGWKKGANWSFPRGKINKDENDLKCAVREVYEETGFDIQEAGLVKDEKEMKYIEVTMREQHIRLYVFRGVPVSTHFEPRTRKEISKIEWYKLTDLPTLRKQKQQDSNTQLQAVNANKFYMVAPFLNPLKKWISQQRKTEHRESLSYFDPPIVPEEASQDDTEVLRPQLQHVSSHGPSNLPEVAYTTQQQQDPSADLKRMLNINVPASVQTPASRSKMASQTDVAKSSALLALLRNGSTAEMRDMPNTPQEPVPFSSQMPSSHQMHLQPSSSSSVAPERQFQISPEPWHRAASHPHETPTSFGQRQDVLPFVNPPAPESSIQPSSTQAWQEVPDSGSERLAPYQNRGDPQFSRSVVDSSFAVPPASALPKLTSHTKSLLDAFKMSPPLGLPTVSPQASAMSPVHNAKVSSVQTQTLLDIFKAKPREASLSSDSQPTLLTTAQPFARSSQAANHIRTLNFDVGQRSTDHFRRSPYEPAVTSQAHAPISTKSQPAELAADAAPQTHGVLKRDRTKATANKQHRVAAPREGETAATVSGPLNQPQFDGIARSSRRVTNGDRRSPVPLNKTLFDHRNPTPMKILARSEDVRASPAPSPKHSQLTAPSSSPRRAATPKEYKEPPKPFQPQILRRPQTPSTALVQSKQEPLPGASLALPEAQPTAQTLEQRPLQADSHKQALLSLFNNPLQASQGTQITKDLPSGLSTTTPASQPVSSSTASQMHGIEPISTRSRVGSLVSGGGTKRPGNEKRQTAAGDKAFLLGYLGRIASQEGQLPDVL